VRLARRGVDCIAEHPGADAQARALANDLPLQA